MSRILGPAARGNLSLVLSALALLVAMSGTAYAVANGSIKTKHLAAGAVTTPKIKDRAVTTPKIKDGAVIAPKVGAGAVTGPKLGAGAVTETKVGDGAVTGPKLAPNAVTGGAVEDGSLTLADLGGTVTDQVTLVPAQVNVPAGECREIFLTLYNPAPNGILGSMVVGTITSSTGGAVVNNAGSVLPTLVTATSQGGAIPHLMVCAGGSAQTVPANSVATWSLIAP